MTSKTSFGNWSIAAKLNVVQSIALAVLFVISITWLTSWMAEIMAEGDTRTVQQINRQTLNMIQVYNESLEKNIDRMGNILKESLPSDYAIDTARHVNVAGTQTPVLKAGSEVLNLNFAIVDRFTATSGAVATVFARDGDDFVRVTTSLKKENGDRAIGTKLDRDHPARAALLTNKAFTGKATLFKHDYMTYYLPVRDASGTVVGALFVGLDFTSELAALRQKIREIKFGNSGYMYVLDAGKTPGTMVVHPTLEGKNLYDEKDDNGFAYIHAIVEQKSGVLSYRSTDPGEAAANEKIAVFDTIPKWNWIIVSCLHYQDIAGESARVRNPLIVGAIVLCALLFFVVFFTSRHWVARPLTEAVLAVEQIAEGQLTIAIPERGSDEVGRLLAATNLMAGKMRSALADIQNAAQQLAGNAERLVSTANEVAGQSSRQSDSASTMASSIEEMNANLVHVSENAQQANRISLDSDRISSEGAVVVQHATDSMERIADTVRAASGVVSTLGQESQAISTIVNVIREIAEQTNLLALNAAIEAARAGEQGRGFAVVADEVRKLAERTSNSTQEISALIRRILDGTANAVASMEAGVSQVDEGVSYAGQAGGSIAGIRQSASQVTAAIAQISQSLAEQSSAISSISGNVEQIATMADQNSQIASESAQCAADLKQLAQVLRERISHFSI
ncbi:MAG: methyl-accepting chemotaxis protein [Betaproteobacteria bacterium]|nr:methyl-accepting chemotaxis protein [Betaproteobacteria bacterium]